MIESICRSLVPVWTLLLSDLTNAELDAEIVTDVDQYAYDFLNKHLPDPDFVDMLKHQLQIRYLECTNGMSVIISEDGRVERQSSERDIVSECNPIARMYEMVMYDLDIEPINISSVSDMNIFAMINAETDTLLEMIESDYPHLKPDA